MNINFFSSKSNNGTESRLAKLLSKSQAVYSTKMDERHFIKYRIIYETLEPDTLVIGSSRTMQISNDIYNEEFIKSGLLSNLSITNKTLRRIAHVYSIENGFF